MFGKSEDRNDFISLIFIAYFFTFHVKFQNLKLRGSKLPQRNNDRSKQIVSR